MFPLYGMFLHPNFTYLGYNYSKYPQSSLFSAFQATQLRFGFGWKKSISFHQFFKQYKGIDIEYSEELSSRMLGINAREVKRESSVTFHKWIQRPSLLFPGHAFTDANSEYFLKVGYKRRRNDIDTFRASPEFLKHALNQDKLFAVKVGYSSSEFKDSKFEEGTTTELSGEYCTDHINSNFLHLKAHHRRFMVYNDYCFQAHAKFDKIIGLNGQKDFSVNDTILLRNFKGVKDVGLKYYRHAGGKVEKNKNRLPVGDALGHTAVLELGLKATSNDLPFFKMYQINDLFWSFRPFVFTNIALLFDNVKHEDSFSFNDHSVASAGFGLQFIHYLLCAELYYTVAVHKRKYEFGTELQFNFGLD
jgi:hypothetical protein